MWSIWPRARCLVAVAILSFQSCRSRVDPLWENFSGEKGRKAKQRNEPTSLGQFVHDLGDLLAKKPSAPRGRMADAVCIHIEFFQLSGGDFSQRDDLIARK